MVKRVENEAAEVAQNATAQSSLILSKAQASATAIVEKARSDGLNHLYTEIGELRETGRVEERVEEEGIVGGGGREWGASVSILSYCWE